MINYLKRFFGPGGSGGARMALIIFVAVALALAIGLVQFGSNDFTRDMLREVAEGSPGDLGGRALALLNIVAYLAVVWMMPALVLGAVLAHLLHRFSPPPKRKVNLKLKPLPQHAQLLPNANKSSQEWSKPSLSNPSSSRKTGRDA